MRKQLYLGIIGKLKSLQDENGGQVIRHFDLWNEQVAFIEQEEAFDIPAVFVEFLPIQWQYGTDGARTADAQFRLHIVTGFKGSASAGSPYQKDALLLFDLLDDITAALFRLSGEGFRDVQGIRSDTNHNHEEIIESLETFRVSMSDGRAARGRIRPVPERKPKIRITGGASLPDGG